ncbi:MAG TPA: GNAT family N-acetyltransferase [Pseudomonadales bacterium]|nr:GNAT family N-acetyltransferase [Pseudomonadales bacterium]
MKARFISSIEQISADKWNSITRLDYPFLRHEFLHALEASQSVCAERGWQPQHLLIENNEQLLAVLPLYIKNHSMGEYVFDHSWAKAYQRNGLPYYPKLLSAIPFTPASGPRLSFTDCDESLLIKTVAEALEQQCHDIGASGWHVLFPQEKELLLWQQANSNTRLGCQFHWFNCHYKNFDDFLAGFSSRKRKELKRERRRVADQNIRLECLTGEQITIEHWQAFYRFYQLTNLKYNGHGGYLTGDFFVRLHQTMRNSLLLVMAYNENNEAIAGALNFFSSDTLFGRYWGSIQDVEFLHFEACYYQGIEFCIERGLQRFDPGAQGEHKIPRGFQPTLTYSQHWIAHPGFRDAIKNFLAEESKGVEQYKQDACTALPFK